MLDATTHQRIKDKLKVFLNRDPSDAEIMNSENDPVLRGWLREEDIEQMKIDVAKKQDKVIPI